MALFRRFLPGLQWRPARLLSTLRASQSEDGPHAEPPRNVRCGLLAALVVSLVVALAAALALPAQAAVTVTVVGQSATGRQLRIDVGAPKLETVDTPAGPFACFSMRDGSSVTSGQNNRGLPELPVTGFPLALPVDPRAAPGIGVRPLSPANTLSARPYPGAAARDGRNG